MCAVICRKATFTLSVSAITLPDANFPTSRAQNRGFCALLGSGTPVFGHFEHKIEVFVLFWPSGPLFSGISSTKSPFLCSFTKLDVGLGDFPAESGVVATAAVATIVAPAQPILPLTLPPLHLLAAAPAQPLCQLPLLAAAPAQPILLQPTTVAPDGACGLGYHSGLGGGVEDVVD